ncbi:MAG: hypothetical protein KGZ63_10255 [Clostridiales bacterium]|nr:hypothetical protein [Clostridiales bacterium]
MVMQHRGLHIKSKAIFLYLAADAGQNFWSSPKRERIWEHLGISTEVLQAAEELGVNGFIFTWLTITHSDDQIILAPSTPLFLDEVKNAHASIDRIMTHMGKRYELRM